MGICIVGFWFSGFISITEEGRSYCRRFATFWCQKWDKLCQTVNDSHVAVYVRVNDAFWRRYFSHNLQVKLVALSEKDIEAYLATFERIMEAYKVPKSEWMYHLAPQLTGRAQQAFAALPGDNAQARSQTFIWGGAH